MPRLDPGSNHAQEHHRKSHSSHHHHNHNKKQLKASSMATRKPTDTKKLLTKTYSEIGVNNSSTSPNAGGTSPGTPTPSEKVSKWHRDILLVSPSQNPHPRQCICDQCMAEYGTYRIYNQLLDNPSSTVIKVSEEAVQRQGDEEINEEPAKNDKVGKDDFIFTNFLKKFRQIKVAVIVVDLVLLGILLCYRIVGTYVHT